MNRLSGKVAVILGAAGRDNMGQTIAESGAGGQGDRVVWPFGSVQVESYWPQLISLKPQ